ncbi:MAG: preprotein translocase subunit YajC [Fibrobacterota bacterium]
MKLLFILSSVTAPVWAQGSGAGKGSLGAMLLPMIFMFAVIYIFIILPQKRKQKNFQKMVDEIKKGDKVVTIGGIYGKVVSKKEKTMVLNIGNGLNIEVRKNAVSGIINPETKEEVTSETDGK